VTRNDPSTRRPTYCSLYVLEMIIWGYGASDMSGTIRAQYPTILRSILVSCSGRVSTDMVMRAFGKGADGVAIIG
jgi:coenzyme F420-reducing hydrogenase delta subunit